MIRYQTEPEYTVEESLEKMLPSTVQLEDTKSRCMVQVQAELRLLSKELTISVDILGRIRDSVQELEQSLEEQP